MSRQNLKLNIEAASNAPDKRTEIWTVESKSDGLELNKPATSKGIHANGSLSSVHQRTTDTGMDRESTHTVESTESQKEPPKPGDELTFTQRYFSWRYVMVLLMQSSYMMMIFIRNCLPMAMVCMVRPRSSLSSSSSSWEAGVSAVNGSYNDSGAINNLNQTAGGFFTSLNDSSIVKNNTDHEVSEYEFDWSSDVQGLVLTSISFTSFLGPLMAEPIRGPLGNKTTMTVFNVISALLTLLSPLAARISPYALIALRCLLGITQGANIPVVGDTIAWWAPQSEKLTMTAFSFTGMNLGGVLCALLSGYLCAIPVDNGWPFVFYFFGASGILWSVAWHFLSTERPEEHPYISLKERQYIISHRVGMEGMQKGKREKPPYRKVLCSVPVLAYLSTNACHLWAMQLIFTYLPFYISSALRFSVQETGLLVSAVSASRMCGSFTWTIVCNAIVGRLGTNRARKICFFLGYVVAGSCQVGIGFFDENSKWVALGLLVIVMVTQAVGSSVLTAVPLDMAPRYAGFITGMCVSFGSLVSISGPLVAAELTRNGTAEEWKMVWIAMSSVFLFAAFIFTIFGQASIQPWAQPNRKSLAHVVSPFVTMGRRFSTFVEAPPMSPVTPIKSSKFDFSMTIQATDSSALPVVDSTNSNQLPLGHAGAEERDPNIDVETESVPGRTKLQKTNEISTVTSKAGYENTAFEGDKLPKSQEEENTLGRRINDAASFRPTPGHTDEKFTHGISVVDNSDQMFSRSAHSPTNDTQKTTEETHFCTRL